MKLEFFIAIRYLLTKNKERFVSIINMFALIGVILGVATLIIVMSVMNGYEKELLDKILCLKGHLTVTTRDSRVQNWKELVTNIEKNLQDIKSVIPVVEQQALVISNERANGVIVKGMLKDDIFHRSTLEDKIMMLPSEFEEEKIITSMNIWENVVIGNVLARNLGINKGDNTIKIIVPKFNQTMVGSIPRMKTYHVDGTFDVGMHEYNSSFLFMSLENAQKLFKIGDQITGIEITLNDINNLNSVKAELINMLRENNFSNDKIIIIDWKEANKTLVEGLSVERNVMFLILSLIIVIAVFNIISSLVLLVRDKMKSIAILRTLGMQKGAIMRIFIICGFTIGFVGTIIGAIIGVIFCIYIDNIKNFLEKIVGMKLFDPVIYFLTTLPAEVNFIQISYIVTVSLVLSLLATIYPAWRVALTSPAEVLKY